MSEEKSKKSKRCKKSKVMVERDGERWERPRLREEGWHGWIKKDDTWQWQWQKRKEKEEKRQERGWGAGSNCVLALQWTCCLELNAATYTGSQSHVYTYYPYALVYVGCILYWICYKSSAVDKRLPYLSHFRKRYSCCYERIIVSLRWCKFFDKICNDIMKKVSNERHRNRVIRVTC